MKLTFIFNPSPGSLDSLELIFSWHSDYKYHSILDDIKVAVPSIFGLIKLFGKTLSTK